MVVKVLDDGGEFSFLVSLLFEKFMEMRLVYVEKMQLIIE